jgi:hypothetical protein
MEAIFAFVIGLWVGLLLGVWLMNRAPEETPLHQRRVIQLPTGKGPPPMPAPLRKSVPPHAPPAPCVTQRQAGT